MHTKIAVLIRDITQFGGGEKDVITLIKGLNEHGITPYLFSEKDTSQDEIISFFNTRVTYHYKNFPRPKSNISRVFAEVFLPHPLTERLKEFDFIYDFTNKAPVYFSHPHYLKYVYIFKDSRVLNASSLRNAQFNLYQLLAKIGIKKFIKISPKIINVTQSKYAQKEIYSKTNIKLPIIYPPVDIEAFSRHIERMRQVITVSRISPEKNIEAVIRIAQKIPNLNFIVIGKTNNHAYLKALRIKIKALNIANIELLVDIPRKILIQNLEKSEFFISTTKNEHFGIAISEAIAAGCIPFSDNSGGPIEIINNKMLLFNSIEDATAKILKIDTLSHKKKEALVTELQKNNKKFNGKEFKTKCISYLNI